MRLVLLGLLAACPLSAIWEGCIPLRWDGGPLEVARRGDVPAEQAQAIRRWYDGGAVGLLERAPYSCLVLTWSLGEANEADAEQRELALAEAARLRLAGMTVLASVLVGPQALDAGLEAARHFDAVVFEGSLAAAEQSAYLAAIRASGAKAAVIFLGDWEAAYRGPDSPVMGAVDGYWPGLLTPSDAEGWESGPTSEPWVLSNGWRALAVRAGEASKPVWLGQRPERRRPQPLLLADLKRAVADAALGRGRWVAALNDDLRARLAAGGAEARREWDELSDWVRFIEGRKAEWADYRPSGIVAVVHEAGETGSFDNFDVLNMLSVRQLPARIVLRADLPAALSSGDSGVLAYDLSLSGAEAPILRSFVHQGGVLMTGPQWQRAKHEGGDSFPSVAGGTGAVVGHPQPKLDADRFTREVRDRVDESALAPRLFNVGTIASLFSRKPSTGQALLELVEYGDYPTENVTVRLPRKYERATLYAFGAEPEELEIYPAESGPGIEIEIYEVDGYCAVVLE